MLNSYQQADSNGQILKSLPKNSLPKIAQRFLSKKVSILKNYENGIMIISLLRIKQKSKKECLNTHWHLSSSLILLLAMLRNSIKKNICFIRKTCNFTCTKIKTKKVHHLLSFNRSQWLKLYTKCVTQKRIEAEKNGAKDRKVLNYVLVLQESVIVKLCKN